MPILETKYAFLFSIENVMVKFPHDESSTRFLIGVLLQNLDELWKIKLREIKSLKIC